MADADIDSLATAINCRDCQRVDYTKNGAISETGNSVSKESLQLLPLASLIETVDNDDDDDEEGGIVEHVMESLQLLATYAVACGPITAPYGLPAARKGKRNMQG